MERMRTSRSFVSSLKDCAKKKDLYEGSRIHSDILDSGLLENNTYLGNALVSMYVKCGAFARAQQVFDKLPVRDVVSWNSLIAGYAQQGQGQEAMGCFQRMRSEGLSPNAITYACVLKACGSMQDAGMGKKIHYDIVSQGLLKKDVVLGNALVDMYAKCGVLQKAQKVFEELPVRDVVSWNALIAGYCEQGQGQEALSCFQQMQSQGVSPNSITYACILKACGTTQDVETGKKIHDDIVRQGLLQNNVVLGNALVDMYAKCGVLQKAQKVFEELSVRDIVSWTALVAGYVKCGAFVRAQQVFDELPVRNVVSWNTLIAGYAQQGQGHEALRCFQQMQEEGVPPDVITYACILKACGSMQDANMGKKFHDDIVSQGLFQKNLVLGNALVDMYAKCGILPEAQKVLEELALPDNVSWNALIAGYAEEGQGQEALACFQRMQSRGISPDAITYACILKACGIMQDANMGKKLHNDIVSQGLLEKNVVLGNALVDMYAKCGEIQKAQKVLEELLVRDVVSWNALIAGYTEQGQGQEALVCFRRMQSEGVPPNAITYACILKACGTMQDADMGKKIHDDIVSQGLLQKFIVLGNALVDMYAKCGVLQKAQKVFEELPVRDVVSWNALMAGYVEQGLGLEALICFQRMQSEGVSPDAITYACILKACGTTQDVDMGKKIHCDIVSQGLLKKDDVLGNALIDMYAKCGVLQKAQKVLEELSVWDIVSWNALIGGYAEQGQGQEALGCFQRMQSQGVSPDAITYACILKACGITQDADMGKKIHDEIVSRGLLQKDVLLGTALVDMYAKCGVIQKAQKVLEELPVRDVVSWNALIAGYVKCSAFVKALQVFDELPVRNVVSWNTVIAGYTQQGQGQEALGCFQRMQKEGVSLDVITYACILKACGSTRDADMGKKIHDDIVSQGLLQRNVVLGSALVDMYAKCGVLKEAKKVLEKLAVRDVISWNALIGGYAERGQGQEALNCFQWMQSQGVSPDAITYACILKACDTTQNANMGKGIHDEILRKGLLQKNAVLGNALVNMYAKCGVLQKAQKVLEELPVRDVVSWNALIAGYTKQGQGQEALGCFQRMQSEGVSPNAVSYACIMKACGTMQDADMGKKIHDVIVSQGLLQNNDNGVLGTALVHMYARCGILQKAQKVLEELPNRDVVSWNGLIAGYAERGHGQEVLGCFQQMQSEGVSPDAITYACILMACGTIQDADMGKTIHDDIVSQGLLKKDLLLGNALVDMYVKCGVLQKAQKVFEELPVRDVVSWNALIAGYAEQGQGHEALGFFQQMQSQDVSPDAITYACILKACGTMQDADMAKEIYDYIVSQGLLKKDVVLGNALVDMYAKCGVLQKAQKVLEELPVQDVVSWNALIAGYVEQGQGQEALGCFQRMQSQGVSPDAITYACILKACGTVQDADMGKKFHDDIASLGMLQKNVVLGNALVDMYAKCGVLQKAQNVVEELFARNVDSWNALIAGYAEQGRGQEALGCLQRMQRECITPNSVSYSFVLKAMLTS